MADPSTLVQTHIEGNTTMRDKHSKTKRKSQYKLRKRVQVKDLPLDLPEYVEAGPEEPPFDWPERVSVFWDLKDEIEQLSLFPHKNFFEELKAL